MTLAGPAAFAANPYVNLVLAGMQAGVAAVIASVVWQMGTDVVRADDKAGVLIMAAAFAACLLGVNVVLVVLAAAGVGVARTLLKGRHAGKGGAA